MKAAGDKGKCIRCNEHKNCEFGWCCVQGGGELAGARRGVYGGKHSGANVRVAVLLVQQQSV